MSPKVVPLVDVHVHFYQSGASRADWREYNARRMAQAEQVGVTLHIASILGTWGHTSPTYFPSPDDVTAGNKAMRAIAAEFPGRIVCYTTVNPNYTAHAVKEIETGRAAGDVGIKLAASRRCSDPLHDPLCELAARHGLPVLQHIWQHRRGDLPGQEASDALDLIALAQRHPKVRFLLAHIGGGGDWAHSLRALRDVSNIYVDLSGSGVDRGMLELCVEMVGFGRLLWGTDLTMDSGLAKLRAFHAFGVSEENIARIRWRNAASIFTLPLKPDDPPTVARAERRSR